MVCWPLPDDSDFISLLHKTMSNTSNQKTLARRARESVAEFLGVAGETPEEWQKKTGTWARRSLALHDQGQLLAKVNKQPMTPKQIRAARRASAEISFEKDIRRPSVMKMAYDGIRDKMVTRRPLPPGQPEPPPPGSPMSPEMLQKKQIRFTEPDKAVSPERELGKGLVGEFLQREYRKSRLISEVQLSMANLTTYRPFFTYWVTFVQIAIYFVTIAFYGVGPIGIGQRTITGHVPKASLTTESVHYLEKENLWIGPTQTALIHLGAKFSPCMRKDYNIEKAIQYDRSIEREMACCIYNDGSGCAQLGRSSCSNLLSVWKKWPSGKVNRKSGSVCGQDPRICKNPPPTAENKWPDDITRWPVCRESGFVSSTTEFSHMTCELTGRPCCVGIQGECLITSDQHCKFLRGYFHPNNTLCSQVFCMNSICGMIPFYAKNIPDQFIRLITSQFVHAGLLQLLITLLFQGFIMRDIEQLIGWLRLSMIYLFSGLIGSLASAIFLPYHVEAGPSGSQFGMAACLFVEVVQNWYILYQPWLALLKLTMILVVLFFIGLLPMIDNYAHLFGFMYGFLLAFALMPNITFNVEDRRFKLIGVSVCLILAILLFVILVILFYVAPIYSCKYCSYFNCLPLTESFCVGMEIKISRNDTWYS